MAHTFLCYMEKIINCNLLKTKTSIMKTLKIFTVGLATLFIANISYAQVNVKSPLKTRFGIKAGINLANVTIKSSGLTLSPSSLVAPVGGLYVTLPIGVGGFQIQPELLYSGQGYKVDKVDGTDGGKGNNNYFVVPVLAKYAIASSAFAFYAGPQFGYLLSAKETPTGESSTDVKANYKSTDISSVFGIEYNLPIGLNLSARYQLGMTNVAKDVAADESFKNKSFTFTLGYNIK